MIEPDEFVKLKYRIRQIHESLNRTSPSTSNEPVQRTQQPGVHLPKIELIKFDGRPSMWPPFWEQFNQVIHDNGGLTNVDKFTYLRSVLTGDAALAIAGLPATASCSSDALDILKRRFAKDDLIIQDHMQRLIDLQPVRSPNDLRGLQSLYDTVQSQTRAFKTLGILEDNYSSILYPILLKSLPHDIVLDFNKTIARQSLEERGGVGSTGEQAQRTQQQKASINSMLLFIQTEIESRERTVLHVSVQEDALKSKDKEFCTTVTSTSHLYP